MKAFKTEFVGKREFDGPRQLQIELANDIHWFNHHRVHEHFDYFSPIQFKLQHLKKLSKKYRHTPF
ncbi:IS3 family transposase [Virgibacillus proomii]|uniref:IS3 family transposase n=1 Tax=Virgibacillus proomii TaxID=84407 RepID=UPI00359FD79B